MRSNIIIQFIINVKATAQDQAYRYQWPDHNSGQTLRLTRNCSQLGIVASWRGVIFRMDQVFHLQPISLIVMSPPLAPRSLPVPRAQCLKAAHTRALSGARGQCWCPASDAHVSGHRHQMHIFSARSMATSGIIRELPPSLLRIFLITNVKLGDLNLDLVS